MSADDLLKESQKEISYVSKELKGMLGTKYKNNNHSGMHYVAVFKESSIMIDYIKLVKTKNRVKIKGRCNYFSAKEILSNELIKLELTCNEKTISTFSLENKVYSLAIKKDKENSYIVKYNIKQGE